MHASPHCHIRMLLKHFSFQTDHLDASLNFIVAENIYEVKSYLEKLPNLPVELSVPYLEMLKKALPNTGFRYLIILDGDTPILFSYFQLFALTYKNFNPQKSAGLVKSIIRFFLRIKCVKVLLSGNALRYDTNHSFYDKNILTDDKALEILAAAAEKISDQECASAIILKDNKFTSGFKSAAYTDGYLLPWDDQVMEMRLWNKWHTMDDYISSLSRKYKARAKKIISASKELTNIVLSEELVEKQAEAINRLFMEVVDRQPFVLTKPAPGYFYDLKKLYGDAFEINGVYLEDELIAFSTAFISETSYEIYYVGFDCRLNAEYQLYFNLMFSGMEKAIKLRKQWLKLGRTSFEAKASMGATSRSLDYLIKFKNIPDFVPSWFAHYFSSLEDKKWKERNPFKENNENPVEKLSESYI